MTRDEFGASNHDIHNSPEQGMNDSYPLEVDLGTTNNDNTIPLDYNEFGKEKMACPDKEDEGWMQDIFMTQEDNDLATRIPLFSAWMPSIQSMFSNFDSPTIDTYKQYETIDWLNDVGTRDANHTEMTDTKQPSTAFRHSLQTWLIVFLVGLFVGVIAAAVSVSTEWLSDLKLGYCRSAFYLNKKLCCWDKEVDTCTDWVFWSRIPAQSTDHSFDVHPLLGYAIAYSFYVLSSLLFASVSGLLVKLSPAASGSGIAEIKTFLSGVILHGFFSLKTLLVKSVALIFSVASILSIGKEGPMVHIACSCGDVVTRWFSQFKGNEVKRREIMSAAAAAGVAVAFGAPIGGVLFSLEEMSYYFPPTTMWRTFFCAIVAAVTLQTINPYRTGHLVMYQVSLDRDWHLFEIVPFVLLGIAGGLFGALFIAAVTRVAQCRKHIFPRYAYYSSLADILMVALITALSSYPSVFLRIDTNEVLYHLFNECEHSHALGLCQRSSYLSIALHLLGACLIKILLTILAFGIKVPAGLYIPSMAIGALFGRSLGTLMQILQENVFPTSRLFGSCQNTTGCITPGLYALVGAASVLTGVTRMTVSIVVIVFEITGALKYALPVMIGVMVSKWTGDALHCRGIYESIIRLYRLPYLGGHLSFPAGSTLQDYLSMDRPQNSASFNTAQCISYHSPPTILILDQTTCDAFHPSDHSLDLPPSIHGFPVIEASSHRFVGYLRRSQLSSLLLRLCDSHPPHQHSVITRTLLQSTTPIETLLDPTPFCVQPSISMQRLYELFRRMGMAYVIVTQHDQYVDVVTRHDVLSWALPNN